MLINLDNSLKNYFQKTIQLTLKNKSFKKGRLINFKTSGCYVSIILQTDKKRDIFEVPFPFAIKTINNKLVFDYTLGTLSEQDYDLLINIRSVTQVKKCKFYNTTLSITSLN
jgi:hypothetical protein